MSISRSRIFRIGALLFAILAIVTGIPASRGIWISAPDFDVLGITWLLANLPRLMLGVLSALFTGLALYCLIRPWFDDLGS